MKFDFNTIDVGRIEAELVTSDGKTHRALFIGTVVIHGNHGIRATSATEVYERMLRGEENFVTAVDGQLIAHTDIEQFNITKETAEMVTFAVYPKETPNATASK